MLKDLINNFGIIKDYKEDFKISPNLKCTKV